MRFRLALAAVAAAVLLTATPASAGDPIMPLGDVHAGMQCTAYTVVQGTEISSFAVQVLDVIDGDPAEPGPRILIEGSGLAVDRTGIGPGFSGSPIYCPDAAGVPRNIGAISESIGEYGGKVVLATPIEAMLSNPPEAPRERTPRAVLERTGTLAAGADVAARAAAAKSRMRREGVRPLAAPLTVSGLSRPLGRALEAAGRRLRRPVIAAPAGPLGTFPVQTLRPGASLAVGYSSGDLRLSAIGTVTYTDGDVVWGFGHPFEGSGARALLLQDAYVYRVINDPNTAGDQGGSYKLASPGHDLGTLTNDALDTVVGRVGALPPLIPIRVAAHDDDTRRTTLMHVNAADETDAGTTTGFSPISTVAPMVIVQAGSNVLRSAPGRLTGRMCLTIKIREGRRSARFCNRYVSTSGSDGSGGNAVAINAALDALDAFGLIDSYPGRPPHISRVGARMNLQRGERVADILSVRAPRTVRPGQRIRLRVALRRHRGPRIVRRYRVRVPRDVRPGRRRLVISSGQTGAQSEEDLFQELLSESTGGGESERGPATLDELVAAIRGLGRFDGVTGRIGRQDFTFRDPNLLLVGEAQTRVRVRRR